MKKIFIILSIITMLFVKKTIVNAECWTQYPADYMYMISPTVKFPTRSLTSASATAKGSNTAVYYLGFRSLPSSHPYQDGVIYMYLMEKDVNNADDQVKSYGGTFFNKVVTDFVLNTTYITGNIEATGDPTAELYLKGFISGDCCNHEVQASLFDYILCMN